MPKKIKFSKPLKKGNIGEKASVSDCQMQDVPDGQVSDVSYKVLQKDDEKQEAGNEVGTKEKVEKVNRIWRKFMNSKHSKWMFGLIAIVSLFLILAPFANDIIMPIKKLFDNTDGYVYQNNLIATDDQANIDQSKLKPIPEENVLVIPKIGVDSVIHEGPDEKTLDLGIWRKPLSSDPSRGGNTVLTAHRFLYTFGPNTFYHLDKLEAGDRFYIFWDKKEYDYEIIEKRIVQPTEVEIEDSTIDPMITLYTCTKNALTRIVVKAKLIVL